MNTVNRSNVYSPEPAALQLHAHNFSSLSSCAVFQMKVSANASAEVRCECADLSCGSTRRSARMSWSQRGARRSVRSSVCCERRAVLRTGLRAHGGFRASPLPDSSGTCSDAVPLLLTDPNTFHSLRVLPVSESTGLKSVSGWILARRRLPASYQPPHPDIRHES